MMQLADACAVIQVHNPDRILTIGGDCGVEIAPVSFLNQKYLQKLTVIWLDAHGDLNTPDSSPSTHFHGMPLRTLLGEGDADIVKQAFSTLHPLQVMLVGVRELDGPESNFINQNGLPCVSAQSINEGNFSKLFSVMEDIGFGKIYIHLDLDVIDPGDFPYVTCPTPGGIHAVRLVELLTSLNRNFDVVGCSILEFLPTGADNTAALEIVKLLDKADLLPFPSA